MLETSFNAVLMTISKTMKRIELYAKSYLNLKFKTLPLRLRLHWGKFKTFHTYSSFVSLLLFLSSLYRTITINDACYPFSHPLSMTTDLPSTRPSLSIDLSLLKLLDPRDVAVAADGETCSCRDRK
jgi:hypothetical protein